MSLLLLLDESPEAPSGVVLSAISSNPLKRYDPFILDVTADVAINAILIHTHFRNLPGPPEVVYAAETTFDFEGFSGQYYPGSRVFPIAFGHRFEIFRADGWISDPTFLVYIVDENGEVH